MSTLSAQPPVADWVFVPDYRLPGKAANHPGPRIEHPAGQHPLIGLESAPLLFQGEKPTQRLLNLISPASLPRKAFSFELWLNHHVNKPVAILMSVRGRLADSPVPITLGFHHATYTGEEDDYGDSWKRQQVHYGDQFVRKIVPLYEKYGVDLAMFGHLHLYERSHPIREGKVDTRSGTVHLLAGGGGGDLEDFAPTPAFFSAKTYPGHHYVMIEVHGDKLSMRMQDLNGVIRDWLTLEKGLHPDGLQITREKE